MILTNKLLPVALISALIGGSVGALVMHKSQPASAETMTAAAQTTQPNLPNATQQEEVVPAQFNTSGEQTAYKTGFADGYAAATDNRAASTTSIVRRAPSRVVYRNSRSRATSRCAGRDRAARRSP